MIYFLIYININVVPLNLSNFATKISVKIFFYVIQVTSLLKMLQKEIYKSGVMAIHT